MGKNRDAYKLRNSLALQLANQAVLVLFVTFVCALKRNFSITALAADNAPQFSLSLLYFPRFGYALTTALLLFALLTTLNAGMLAASRLLYVVARDDGFTPAINRVCVRISENGVTYGGMLVLLAISIASLGLQIWLNNFVQKKNKNTTKKNNQYSAYLFSFLRLRKDGP